MNKREKVIEIIYSTIDDEINSLPSREEPLQKSEDTILFGGPNGLDSLDLVNLIIGVEEQVCDAFDSEVALAAESAMSEENSPYRTVKSLVDYILTLLETDPDA